MKYYKVRRILLSISILVVILSLPDCRRDEFVWGTRIGDLTYSEEVVLLGREELELLTEVTGDQMVFSSTSDELDVLTNLNIVVAGITEKTPYGLMRKITAVNKNGNSVSLSTTDAILTDIIKEGILTFRVKLKEEDFTLYSKMDGVLVTGDDKAFDGLAITLEDFELFRNGSVIAMLNGSIGISPEIDLTIKFKANKVTEVESITTLNKIDELTITSNGPFEGKEELVLAEFSHSPMVFDSLVFVPKVKFVCGFDGNVAGEVISGVRQDNNIKSVVKFLNSKWVEDPLEHSDIYDFTEPVLSQNADIEIFSGPEVTLYLFGNPLQNVKSTAFFSLLANASTSPRWRIYIGGEGKNIIFSNILGIISDNTSDLTIQSTEITGGVSRK